MADFILTTIGGSLTGTSANDNMTFGIQVIDTVPFIATGSLSGAGGDDTFFTLNPNALINGIQTAYGNKGNDTINLANLFTAYGGEDNDSIQSNPGDLASQQMFGGKGNDTIISNGGNDYIEGNQGFDNIDAGSNNDLVWGGQENDTINGGSGADTLYGNLGGDLIDGSAGIEAGIGADSLHGGQGNDTVRGSLSVGGDHLNGNADDTIIGGAGQDMLTGGPGNNIGSTPTTNNSQYDDLFRYQDGFAANVGIANIDVITDFQSAALLIGTPNLRPDKISLSVGEGAVLGGLNFTTGTTYDLNQYIPAGGTATNIPNVPAGILVPGRFGAATPAINLDLAAIRPADGFYDTYEEVFAGIQQAFTVLGGTPVASSNGTLQVLNATTANVRAGSTLALAGSTGDYLFINNGNTNVSSVNDMLIDGVNVVDFTASVPTDIVFG